MLSYMLLELAYAHPVYSGGTPVGFYCSICRVEVLPLEDLFHDRFIQHLLAPLFAWFRARPPSLVSLMSSTLQGSSRPVWKMIFSDRSSPVSEDFCAPLPEFGWLVCLLVLWSFAPSDFRPLSLLL